MKNVFRFAGLCVLGLTLVGCNSMGGKAKDDRPAECFQAPDKGNCKAAFRYYYFNQDSQSCEQFIYGGCGGTVPFKTADECQQACQ